MPSSSFINNTDHWKQRDQEMRVLAEQMNDDQSKETMLGIAEDYKKPARRALQR